MSFGFHANLGAEPHMWFDGTLYWFPYTHLNKGSTKTRTEEFREYYDNMISVYGNEEYYNSLFNEQISASISDIASELTTLE